MRMLTQHGDEIVDEFFTGDWDSFRESITPVDVTPCQKFLTEMGYDLANLREDLGCVRLPWQRAWVEYYEDTGNVKRVGCHVAPMAEEEKEVLVDRLNQKQIESLLGNEEVEHAVSMLIFNSLGKRTWEYAGILYLFLDEDGRLVSEEGKRIYPMYSDRYKRFAKNPDPARLQTTMVIQAMPVLLGFAFAHCPNVVISEDQKPEAVRKKRIKSGKNPGQTFKVLDIEPLKEEIRRESSETGESEVERARHKVRGHFKHYTEDAPLFGHTTGNIWCPPHERGDEDEGHVDKEYRSKPPGGD